MRQCDGFGGAGVPPALCFFLELQTRQPSAVRKSKMPALP